MKKTYLEPSIQVVDLHLEGAILADSLTTSATNGGLSNMEGGISL